MTAGVRGSAVAAGRWMISDSRTRATFAVGNLGHVVHGSVACTWGEVEVDGTGRPVGAHAGFELDSLVTGSDRRDRDLRKPHLLDIDRHPVMTWRCTRFEPAPDEGWTAHGTLSVRAAGRQDRTTVGIRAPRLMIGRWVELSIDAWLAPSRT